MAVAAQMLAAMVALAAVPEAMAEHLLVAQPLVRVMAVALVLELSRTTAVVVVAVQVELALLVLTMPPVLVETALPHLLPEFQSPELAVAVPVVIAKAVVLEALAAVVLAVPTLAQPVLMEPTALAAVAVAEVTAHPPHPLVLVATAVPGLSSLDTSFNYDYSNSSNPFFFY